MRIMKLLIDLDKKQIAGIGKAKEFKDNGLKRLLEDEGIEEPKKRDI